MFQKQIMYVQCCTLVNRLLRELCTSQQGGEKIEKKEQFIRKIGRASYKCFYKFVQANSQWKFSMGNLDDAVIPVCQTATRIPLNKE